MSASSRRKAKQKRKAERAAAAETKRQDEISRIKAARAIGGIGQPYHKK